MLKVLMIDDEKLVRQMAIRCIDWEEIGLQIAGEASSARMGREMIEELHPDIVFMDVRMPGMDGLTCSRLVLEQYPHIKIIILSGHNEFEYASEAIKIGVFDYLLKPINADELRKAAIKVRDTILEERDHRKEFERYKEELEKHSAYIRDRQLSTLVSSRNPRQYLESLEYFGITFQNTVFQAALVEVREKDENSFGEEKLLMKMHTRQLIEDYYGDQEGIYVCDSGADWILIVNNESEGALYDHGEDLKQYLENNMDAQVLIGVGTVYDELEKLRASYKEAQDALKYRFVSGEGAMICFRDIYPYYDADQDASMDKETIREVGNSIRINDAAGAEDTLDGILDQMKKRGGERDQVIILAVEIFAEIMKILSELKVEAQSERLSYSAMIEGVFSLNTFEEIREYTKEIVREACMTIRGEVSDKEKNLVRKVKDYIQEHYMEEEVSLNSLAASYYVNASYLSRVFKEKTGYTFTNYLFECRMKEAERLVLNTDLKAYEIAEKVGISDPHYFSACFKKHTGKSVSEYKKYKNL